MKQLDLFDGFILGSLLVIATFLVGVGVAIGFYLDKPEVVERIAELPVYADEHIKDCIAQGGTYKASISYLDTIDRKLKVEGLRAEEDGVYLDTDYETCEISKKINY